MARTTPAKTDPRESVGSKDKAHGAFTAEERAAMKARSRELKAEARARRNRERGEKDLLAQIARMPAKDRALATRLHAIVKADAAELSSTTWYGMPAYANEDGKNVCYFRAEGTFKERYATLGFSDKAKLDDGAMWPTGFAFTKLTAAAAQEAEPGQAFFL